ncbi:hypothetical protein [Allofrancisella frigidaquae]|uniref:Lipoprotein n=1 Tax=Allofrancisella frigidaquae TaxID=1085644 RepID=A0A6M3HTP2_9GAMM|nr:hypothetical protein [Allofrancisella frigidaquae]QIV94400.1 hypothetical protein E3E15_03105 [Allofrancisella frigidaquae]
MNYIKSFIVAGIVVTFLTSCTPPQSYDKNLWYRYHNKSSSSSKLHSKLIEMNEKTGSNFNWTHYDVRNK